jgi:hypothetical protein
MSNVEVALGVYQLPSRSKTTLTKELGDDPDDLATVLVTVT